MKTFFQYCLDKRYITGRIFATICFAVLYFTFSQPIFSQDSKKTISVRELIHLLQADEEVIEISNVEINFFEEDKAIAENKIFYWVFTLKPNHGEAKKIYFYDCDFNTGTKAPLVFEGWNFKKMNMVGCTSNSAISFENCTQSSQNPLLFENNFFTENIIIQGDEVLENIEINNCNFSKDFQIKTDVKTLLIKNSKFIADTLNFESDIDGKTQFQLCLNDQSIKQLSILNCRFQNRNINNIFSIDFEGSVFDKLVLLKNEMNAVNFSNTKFETSILIDSLKVSDFIGVLNFDFPESNTNIPWENLGGEKLALFETSESGQLVPYQAKTKGQLLNTLQFNDLMSAYNKLNSMYHSRGDIASANKSYVEIKTIETHRQKYLLEKIWDLNVYINYKLNIFLSFFSDYATNPGKSLIISLWVLLIFAVLYILSFSGWDGMNYGYFLSQFSLLAEYVHTGDFDGIYPKTEHEHDGLRNEVWDKYLTNGKKVPRVLRLFGKPLHFLGKYQLLVMPNLIRVFNFQPKNSGYVNTGQKVLFEINLFFIIICFLIYSLIVKFANSALLSLNSFVFGPGPDEGLAMYLSVLEGIIGWFLLTFFTITLLSQVLQSS